MRKVLALIIVLAMVLPGLAQAANLSADEDIRIAGTNRYETAVEASKFVYKEGANTVVLAAGEGYADALTGTVLAAEEDAPLLLTKSANIQSQVLAEIARLGAKKVIVLGGEVAVSKAVVGQLEEKGLTVERLAGDNRYETAEAVAKRLKKGNSTINQVFLVSGVNYKDALSIGPVAALNGIPILLTKPGELHPRVKDGLEELGIKEAVFIGGPVAVSSDVEDAVKKLDLDTDRVYGDNAVETALEVAKKYFPEPQKIFVASNADFADGLVAGYLAAKLGGPVLLVKPDKTDKNVTNYITDSKVEVNVIGGEKAVSNDVVKDIEKAVEEKKEEPVVPGGGGTGGSKPGKTISGEEAEKYLEVRSFAYNANHGGNELVDLSMNIKTNEIALEDIIEIKTELYDEDTLLARRMATGNQTKLLLNFVTPNAEGIGAMSCSFIFGRLEETTDYWTSTAYDGSKPTKGVITIKDKVGNIYIAEKAYTGKWAEYPGVIELIDKLPNLDKITLECKEDIEAARAAYNALPKNQKPRVSEDLAGKLKALEDALRQLVEAWESLKSKVTETAGFESDDYTYDSWAAFEEALTDAQLILDSENTTQEEIDNALQILNNALDGLTKRTIYQGEGVKQYLEVRSFGYNANHGGNELVDLSMNIKTNELALEDIIEIKMELYDEDTLLARRMATGNQTNLLLNFVTPNAEGIGAMSCSFIFGRLEETTDYWTSTAYDGSKPTKGVITIKDKVGNIYIAEKAYTGKWAH